MSASCSSASALADGARLPFEIGVVPGLPQSRWSESHSPPSDAAIDTFIDEQRVFFELSHREAASALHNDFAMNDPERALVLLHVWAAACRGDITPLRSPKTHRLAPLRGAANYNDVTCYIDSLIIAMFSRMDNFLPLLYPQTFASAALRALTIWLRLFVNLLRAGECVSADLVRGLLAACAGVGWGSGAGGPLTMQQDAAELFQFVTERLCMPMLSLNVQIAHAGRVDKNDDFKTVQEQLLYLPVPGSADDPPLLLEECLELFFASNIVVDRHLDRDDTDRDFTPPSHHTQTSPQPPYLPPNRPRRQSFSIMTTQPLHGRLGQPISIHAVGTPSASLDPVEPNLHSELSERSVQVTPQTPGPLHSSSSPPPSAPVESTPAASPPSTPTSSTALQRKMSGPPPSYLQLYGDNASQAQQRDLKDRLWTSNNLVSFPAWMCLQLMPFYAEAKHLKSLENVNARQVAAHFSEARPVLAFCLKRYLWDDRGQPQRNNRQVIIPEVIHMPSFVADDSDREQTFGNFKLVLESVVFHRGANTHSGHYTTLTSELVYPEEELPAPSLNCMSSSGAATSNGSSTGTLGSRLFRNRSKKRYNHATNHHNTDSVHTVNTPLSGNIEFSQPLTAMGSLASSAVEEEQSGSAGRTPEVRPGSAPGLQQVCANTLPGASYHTSGTSSQPSASIPMAQASAPRRRWLYCDCSALPGEKVSEVDFNKAMESNQPYLLFYRMVALEDRGEPKWHEPAIEIQQPPTRKSLLSRSRFLRGRHNEYARQYREEKCIVA